MEHYAHHPELTQEDLLRLQKNPEPYSRAAIANKIGHHFDVAKPGSPSYKMAADIAGFLQKDKADLVRITLAEHLKNSSTAPKTLIVKLANDSVDEVALPILRSSPLLNDADLSKMIHENENAIRLVAIAERRFLSVSLSTLIAAKGYENVSAALLANDTATIDAPTYLKIAEKHLYSPLIMKQMMCRLPMPQEAILLMKKAAANEQEDFTSARKVKSFAATPQQEYHTTLQQILALKQQTDAVTYLALASEFQRLQKINVSTLLLALGCGHTGLFYACIATVTETKLGDLGMQDTDQRDRLNTLLLKAGISASLIPLLHWVLQGATQKLEQGVLPCSKQMFKLMSIRLHEGARRGVNFASTIGNPVANMLDTLI